MEAAYRRTGKEKHGGTGKCPVELLWNVPIYLKVLGGKADFRDQADMQNSSKGSNQRRCKENE